MSIKERVKPYVPVHVRRAARRALNRVFDLSELDTFSFGGGGDVAEDITRKYGSAGDIVDIFAHNDRYVVNKWHHYLPIYHRYFHVFRGKPVRFLEIGVSKGGSLQMWRRYFGPDAIIYGIDIDPACRQHDGVAGNVRIGSQDDPHFLAAVIAEMGGIDIVLDDGSHQMRHIPASLEFLFDKLSDGGLYMIEDLHTAFWRDYGGGYGRKGNFFNYLREITDDIHHWYHRRPRVRPVVSQCCTGVHIHDSIVVLDKGPVYRPTHSSIGGESRRAGRIDR